jgi:hypothetical protein
MNPAARHGKSATTRTRRSLPTLSALALGLAAAIAPANPEAAPPPAGAARDVQEVFRRFALAVGSNEGGPGRDTLLYAHSDANAFGALLGELGGVAAGDARVLTGPEPEDLDRAFRDLRERIAGASGKGDLRIRSEAVVYYSGHADEKGLLLGRSRYPYDRFRRMIDSLPADVRIAVLDACASGAITRLKGGRRRPAFAVDASSDMRGYAFLTSSSPDEASQESDQIRSSFFTHYLVSGMRGAADVSGDGKVTLGEAYQFAFHETLARTERTKGGAQHPAYDMKLSGTGDVVMTDMRQTSAGLVLAKELEGRLFVRNRDNQLVAELYKPAGRAVELGLAPGAYTVRLESRKSLAATGLELEEGRRAELTSRDFKPVGRESTAMRGGDSADGGTGTAPVGAPGVEIRDQVDIPAGKDSRYMLSLGFLLNRQREPFHGLQLTLFFNHADAGVHGGQVSAFGNINEGKLRGAQFSPIGSILLDSLHGVQVAGLFNFALDGGVGAQGAGIFNVSGAMRGGQGAGTFNVSRGLRGGQGAGIANLNLGRTRGGQGAGVFNLSLGLEGGMGGGVANFNLGPGKGGMGAGILNVTGSMEGGMGAGILNFSAGDVRGAQGAGILNAARNVTGAQVSAILNVARDVEGLQIGLVNISRDYRKGMPIGLVNYSHTGLHSLNVWADEMGYQHATALSGTRHAYTYLSIGRKSISDRNLVALGLGLGFQRSFGAWAGSADLGAFHLIEDWDFDTGESHDAPELYRLRLQGIKELLPYVSVFGGASLNYLWNHSGRDGHGPWWDGLRTEVFEDQSVWPGLFAGIRLGR